MNTSKGEQRIIKLLSNANIKYSREKIYPDLKHNGVFYRYDFFLPNVQGGPVLIEYDGEQHFNEAWGGRQELLRRKENDRKKNSFALANNIPLYRIPYWDFDKLTSASDLFQDKYKVASKWYNDQLSPPEK